MSDGQDISHFINKPIGLQDETCLHIAARSGALCIVQLLHALGSDINIKDRNNKLFYT